MRMIGLGTLSAEEAGKKYLARLVYQRAKKSGEIKKQPCKVCGDPKSEGHHEDLMNKPKEVIWLCRKHHREADRLLRRKKGLHVAELVTLRIPEEWVDLFKRMSDKENPWRALMRDALKQYLRRMNLLK